MNPIQNVELLLSQCKEIFADATKMEMEIATLERQKLLHQTGTIESDSSLISGMCLNAPVLSHIPRSITNKFSSVTENVALNYIKFLQPSKEDIAVIEQKIKEKKAFTEECYRKIFLINDMFGVISDDEKLIINKIYLQGYTLNQVIPIHNKRFPELTVYSKETMRRKKFDALAKMANRLK